jgi:signal peptidase I
MNTNDHLQKPQSNTTDTLSPNNVLSELKEWAISIIFAVIAVVLIQNYLYLPTEVSGESMMPTMKNGERFLANRFIYFFTEPKAGDIITFHADESKDYVKRIIATEGQMVEYKNDTLYVDGKVIEEPYLQEYKQQAHNQGTVLTGDFGPVAVPQGKVFVLGDNRKNSRDSRIIGAIDKKEIIGRADLVIWPLNHIRIP